MNSSSTLIENKEEMAAVGTFRRSRRRAATCNVIAEIVDSDGLNGRIQIKAAKRVKYGDELLLHAYM